MSGYTLTWRLNPSPQPSPHGRGSSNAGRIDGTTLRPDTLGALDPAALAQQPLPPASPVNACASASIITTLGDLFDITGSPGERLTICNAPPLNGFGARMKSGELIVEGDAGDDLGASMAGGLIRVTGNAGHRAGAPAIGNERGMTGGDIVIHGNVGDFAGMRMRRGCIAVAGTCGKSPGFRMIAGTIIVGTGAMDHPGLEMRRGTIVSLDAGADIATSGRFAEDGVFDTSAVVVLRLLLRRMVRLGLPVDRAKLELGRRYRLYSGDRMELNKGEIWQPTVYPA